MKLSSETFTGTPGETGIVTSPVSEKPDSKAAAASGRHATTSEKLPGSDANTGTQRPEMEGESQQPRLGPRSAMPVVRAISQSQEAINVFFGLNSLFGFLSLKNTCSLTRRRSSG